MALPIGSDVLLGRPTGESKQYEILGRIHEEGLRVGSISEEVTPTGEYVMPTLDSFTSLEIKGVEPFNTTLSWTATDTANRITKFELDYGDGNIVDLDSSVLESEYFWNYGEYTAKVRMTYKDEENEEQVSEWLELSLMVGQLYEEKSFTLGPLSTSLSTGDFIEEKLDESVNGLFYPMQFELYYAYSDGVESGSASLSISNTYKGSAGVNAQVGNYDFSYYGSRYIVCSPYNNQLKLVGSCPEEGSLTLKFKPAKDGTALTSGKGLLSIEGSVPYASTTEQNLGVNNEIKALDTITLGCGVNSGGNLVTVSGTITLMSHTRFPDGTLEYEDF